MTDTRDTPEDLYPFAEMLVAKLKKQHQLQWDEYQTEDATQDLFLAGWQVWQDEKNVGFAKNRMRDRAKNLLRDAASELKHEPRTGIEQHSHAVSDSNSLWDEEAVRAWEPADPRATIRGDPAEEAALNSYLDGLTDRRRQIVLMRMAGCTAQETADELGISLRTVERELQNLRKDYPNDDSE